MTVKSSAGRPVREGGNKGIPLTRNAAAEFFGVSPPTVDRWVKEGCPVVKSGVKGARSEYNSANVAGWLQKRAVKMAQEGTEEGSKNLKLRGETAEVELKELKLAMQRGEVAPVEDFEATLSAILSMVRSNMRNIPSRVAMMIVGETSERKIKSVLLEEIDIALTRASEEGADDAGEDEDMKLYDDQ